MRVGIGMGKQHEQISEKCISIHFCVHLVLSKKTNVKNGLLDNI